MKVEAQWQKIGSQMGQSNGLQPEKERDRERGLQTDATRRLREALPSQIHDHLCESKAHLWSPELLSGGGHPPPCVPFIRWR